MMKINPTYIREMPNGNYEYGVVEINFADRKRDRLVRQGEAETYDDARVFAHGCATGGAQRAA